MTSRRKPSSVAKGVNRLMPNPTGEGIRQLLGGEPAGKISMEEAEAGIHAALVKGAEPGKITKGERLRSFPGRRGLYSMNRLLDRMTVSWTATAGCISIACATRKNDGAAVSDACTPTRGKA